MANKEKSNRTNDDRLLIFGDTTCPARNVVDLGDDPDIEEFIHAQDVVSISYQMCPPELVSAIIKVNRLRAWIFKSKGIDQKFISEAVCILEDIQKFSPEQWARTKVSRTEQWLIMGEIYHTSVMLYAILSLPRYTSPLSNLMFESERVKLSCNLRQHIENAISSRCIRRFMIWPVVILGVSAWCDDQLTQKCVVKQLNHLGIAFGSRAPSTAKYLLKRLWCSKESSWDAWFNRPYIFTLQPAVNVGPILGAICNP